MNSTLSPTSYSVNTGGYVDSVKGKSGRFTGGFMNLMFQDNSLEGAVRQRNMNNIRLEKLKQYE